MSKGGWLTTRWKHLEYFILPDHFPSLFRYWNWLIIFLYIYNRDFKLGLTPSLPWCVMWRKLILCIGIIVLCPLLFVDVLNISSK